MLHHRSEFSIGRSPYIQPHVTLPSRLFQTSYKSGQTVGKPNVTRILVSQSRPCRPSPGCNPDSFKRNMLPSTSPFVTASTRRNTPLPAFFSRAYQTEQPPSTLEDALQAQVSQTNPLDRPLDLWKSINRADLYRIGLVSLASLLSYSQLFNPFPPYDIVAIAATLVGGYPVFKEAWNDIKTRKMTMSLSMSIGMAAALASKEFFTASVITLVVLISEVLEHLTVMRGLSLSRLRLKFKGRRAIKSLTDLLPRAAEVKIVDGDGKVSIVEVPVDRLKAGDIVRIKPGESIPVDGVVTSGESYVDQSAITGESRPVKKAALSAIYAGTINQSGILEVRTDFVGPNTAYGKIIDAVEKYKVDEKKAQAERLADQAAKYLVSFALFAAAFTYVTTGDATAATSVVIIAGACGIAAGTPLAILGGVGRAAKLGCIVKGGVHLETLGKVDTVVFDKTGTLTTGKLEVVAARTVSGVSADEMLRLAALVETRSEHPVAKAVVRKAREKDIEIDQSVEVTNFEYTQGEGLSCRLGENEVVIGKKALLLRKGIRLPAEVETSWEEFSLLVALDGKFLGGMEVTDVPRPEAQALVTELKRMGLKTIMLTGDVQAVAEDIASQLGVEEVLANQLPTDKLAFVKNLRSEGRIVAMLGDGINDALALTSADVSVAMGSGTDITREVADVVLLGNNLLKLSDSIKTAWKVRSIIRQNLFGTIAVAGFGMVFAGFGFINPILAAAIHGSSDILFILNSSRLMFNAKYSSAKK